MSPGELWATVKDQLPYPDMYANFSNYRTRQKGKAFPQQDMNTQRMGWDVGRPSSLRRLAQIGQQSSPVPVAARPLAC